jgi:uncharacterized membrane protein
MTFLLVLAVATSAAAAGLALRRRFSTRTAARIGMALAMAFAGISHLLMPTPFVQHLPGWVPLREELVLLTGLLEIALGLPANVYVAVAEVEVDGQPGGAYAWLRLPLQLLFIAWALWSTRRIESPALDSPATSPAVGRFQSA